MDIITPNENTLLSVKGKLMGVIDMKIRKTSTTKRFEKT